MDWTQTITVIGSTLLIVMVAVGGQAFWIGRSLDALGQRIDDLDRHLGARISEGDTHLAERIDTLDRHLSARLDALEHERS